MMKLMTEGTFFFPSVNLLEVHTDRGNRQSVPIYDM